MKIQEDIGNEDGQKQVIQQRAGLPRGHCMKIV